MGALFRQAREAQALSQDDVADLTKDEPGGPVSRTTVSSIERGRCLPGFDSFLSLTSVLHIWPMRVIERARLAQRVPADLTGMSLATLQERAQERYWAGDYRGALGAYEAMADRIALDPPSTEAERRRLLAKVEIDRADILVRCSALDAAEVAAKQATVPAQRSPELQAEAYIVLASLHSRQGLHDLAGIEADHAVALAGSGSPRLKGMAWSQKGSILQRAGAFDGARQAFVQARQYSRQARDRRNLVKNEGNIGVTLFHLGRKAAARKQLVRAVDLARKHVDPAAEAFWLIELGRVALDQGAIDDADRYAAAALRIAKPTEQVLTIFRALWLQHRVAGQRDPGDPDRHRLAHLRRLYTRVQNHQGIDVIQEFKREVIDAGGRGESNE